MNSIFLAVLGMILLSAELIPAAPTFMDSDEVAVADLMGGDMLDPDLDLAASVVKRNSIIKQKQCMMQCLVCSGNSNMGMKDCSLGCTGRTSNPSQMRAYHACNKYLHSGRK